MWYNKEKLSFFLRTPPSSEAVISEAPFDKEGVYMKRKIRCPKCGKWLFSIEMINANCTIYIWCRQCKKEMKIKLEPLSQ